VNADADYSAAVGVILPNTIHKDPSNFASSTIF